ncbi:MAG: hypothetical protein QXR48_02155 [Candidatus Woesearchaeota archaeon]
MKKRTIVIAFALLFLAACVPKPEPYVLEERKPAPNIMQEIQQIEEQAREHVHEKLAEQEQEKQEQQQREAQQEEQKPAEEPTTKITIQQEMDKSTKDLGLYPSFFMDGANFKTNFITVVGDEAPSSYVVAVSNLMARTPGSKPIGFSMLASEIKDLSRYNAIIVGNACNNEVVARLLNNPSPCESAPLPQNKGLIRLYESQNGNKAILVAGKTDSLVISAVNAIGTDDFKRVTGSEICVQGTTLVQC